jgi:threonine/homoserine/homoserine lactone efflux protein
LDEQHLYENCWNGKWKCNLANPKQWFAISTIFFSFLAQKNTTNKSQIIILAMYASRAKVNLDVVNASNNL